MVISVLMNETSLAVKRGYVFSTGEYFANTYLFDDLELF
jgi:hypothetical protein